MQDAQSSAPKRKTRLIVADDVSRVHRKSRTIQVTRRAVIRHTISLHIKDFDWDWDTRCIMTFHVFFYIYVTFKRSNYIAAEKFFP